MSALPKADDSTERTREGLTQRDLAIHYRLDEMVADQSTPRPGLMDMIAWAEGHMDRDRASVLTVFLINGEMDPGHARRLAVGRKTFDFLARCLEHEEELATMFRAKAHRERGRG